MSLHWLTSILTSTQGRGCLEDVLGGELLISALKIRGGELGWSNPMNWRIWLRWIGRCVNSEDVLNLRMSWTWGDLFCILQLTTIHPHAFQMLCPEVTSLWDSNLQMRQRPIFHYRVQNILLVIHTKMMGVVVKEGRFLCYPLFLWMGSLYTFYLLVSHQQNVPHSRQSPTKCPTLMGTSN